MQAKLGAKLAVKDTSKHGTRPRPAALHSLQALKNAARITHVLSIHRIAAKN